MIRDSNEIIADYIDDIFPHFAHADIAVDHARSIVVRPADFDRVMGLVRARVDIPKTLRASAHVDVGADTVTFSSTTPLNSGAKDVFSVTTQFYVKSPTVEKRIIVNQGNYDFQQDNMARMRFLLEYDGHPFDQFVYSSWGIPALVYNRDGEMIVYLQAADTDGSVEVKEWLYARKPNCPEGSRYVWRIQSEEFYRRLVFEPAGDGSVNIQRQFIVKGISAGDYERQRHIIEVVRKVSHNRMKIKGEDTVGQVEPVFYVTREGVKKRVNLSVRDHHDLVVEINEPASAYPILIESE